MCLGYQTRPAGVGSCDGRKHAEMDPVVVIDGGAIAREQVVAVVRHNAAVEVSAAALDGVTKTREHVERLAEADTPTYGVSTGFGALATRHIPLDRRAAL